MREHVIFLPLKGGINMDFKYNNENYDIEVLNKLMTSELEGKRIDLMN